MIQNVIGILPTKKLSRFIPTVAMMIFTSVYGNC